MTRLALAAMLTLCLSACGGRAPSGDWRAELGRPSPNLRLAAPLPPLALPPVLDLPVPPAAP